MHAPTYGRAARLVAAIAQAWPLDDPSGAAVEILRAAAPVEVGTPLSAIAPNAIFTDPKDKRWRGAKTMASACAAAAAEAWRPHCRDAGTCCAFPKSRHLRLPRQD